MQMSVPSARLRMGLSAFSRQPEYIPKESKYGRRRETAQYKPPKGSPFMEAVCARVL